MATKLNWERSRQTNRTIGEYSRMSFNATMEHECSSPTAKQIKHFKWLMARLRETGEEPQIREKRLRTRGDYYRAIANLRKQLGIEDKNPDRFEALGDYVAARSEMIERKRTDHKYTCPDCYHKYKSKHMYPCNRCKSASCFEERIENG